MTTAAVGSASGLWLCSKEPTCDEREVLERSCRRPLRAERMVESKWLSRPFWGREGPESGALHRGPPWVCSVHFLLLRLTNTTLHVTH